MPLELKVKWEGAAPGLTEKRLSVGAFGESLTKLLAGLRRIATNIVGEALGDRQSRGRFANAARQLDIEITQIVKESSGFDSIISFTTPLGDTLPILDFGEIAGMQLLDALDAERSLLRGMPSLLSCAKSLFCRRKQARGLGYLHGSITIIGPHGQGYRR